MNEAEQYVKRYLKKELAEVQASPIATVQNGLSLFEKTLVYYYTRDGYKSINKSLRESGGKRGSKAAVLLNGVLKKLPDFEGLVHRTAWLTGKQIQKYKNSFLHNSPLTEFTFVSTSRSALAARLYPKWNVRFQVISKYGKSIEDVSQMGIFHPPNEQEVLFGSGHSFIVLDVTDLGSQMLIILEEV
jgi:hypothetical protein